MMSANFLLHEAVVQPSILLKFHKLGIHTLLDLLHYYPRDHITYCHVTISKARVGDCIIVIGKIQQHRIFTAKNGKLTVQHWTLIDKAEDAIRVTIFHHGSNYQSQQWRTEQHQFYRAGRTIIVIGKVKQDDYTGAPTIDAIEVKVADLAGTTSATNDNLIQPVYALSKGLNSESL